MNTADKSQNPRYALKWGEKSIANCSHNELIACVINAYRQMGILAAQNQAMLKVLTDHDMIQEVEIAGTANSDNGSKITEESNAKETSQTITPDQIIEIVDPEGQIRFAGDPKSHA